MRQAQSPRRTGTAPPSGRAARRAALALLEGVAAGRLLSDLLPAAVAELAPSERARAQRLATETLRWTPRCDRVLGPYLRRRPSPRAHAALRMAVWEICADGAAAHGVVNAVVAILAQRRGGEAGLANAVLRKVGDQPADWDALPLPQMPKWLRRPLVASWGKEAVAAMEQVHAAVPPLDLTPGPRAPADLAERLDARLLPTGSLRLSRGGQVSALAGYAEGWWWVQDAAAAIPARVLDPRPGERVLDLCAAPGGKTLQLAAGGAEVTAVDIAEARMARVAENLERTGLAARTVVADALSWQPAAPADAILLDAPCSGTGTIRRHPDLPYARTGAEAPHLASLQAALLDRALALVRPGGRVVYCTCSLLPEEGEAQVRAALSRHSGLRAESVALSGLDPAWTGPEGLRLRPDFWPERGGMDGFFVALLRKPA